MGRKNHFFRSVSVLTCVFLATLFLYCYQNSAVTPYSAGQFEEVRSQTAVDTVIGGKINVNTECQQYWARIVREVIAKDKDVYDPRKIIGPGKKGIQQTMEEHCKVFGCIGKAE